MSRKAEVNRNLRGTRKAAGDKVQNFQVLMPRAL